VSWQLVTLCLLGLVIAAGFGWYERARPPARLIALVAALAALAVAGRLALAPIPNVVATTDVTLITGYALGPAPGFAVGALAAPVSNIWLGQGPWTAWQMAGWGLVGLFGAWLAMATRRRLGRLGLAAACGVAGLAYGALLDLSVMVTYGGEQSLDRYLALSSRGVPFNLAHAAGNVAIALAAGPALVRMIARYRTRLEFTWRPAGALPAILVLALAGTTLVAPPASARAAVPGKARAWLVRQQNPDGGFGATPGYRSSPAMTGWAVLGLEAAGRNPADVRAGGRTPLSFLRSRVERLRSTGDLERTILALDGAGRNPHRFAGRDLVAQLRSRRSLDGSFSGQVNLTAFGILALRAAGASQGELSGSASWLAGAQNGDGGWGFNPGAPSDPDSTGAALQGLAVSGGGPAMADGVGYLRGAQRSAGGWGLAETGVTNTQSTAWAVQGLVAAGVDPSAVRKGGKSPMDYLRARRAGDGHYAYSAASDQTPIWVTGQALLAVRRAALPLPAVPRAARGKGVSRPASGKAPSSQGGAATPGSAFPAPAGDADGGGDRSGGGSTVTQRGNDDAGSERGRETGVPQREPGVASGEAADPGPLVGAPAAVPADPGDPDEPRTPLFVAGAFAALVAALGAGFLWYRRRLS
jgi:uncharacterized membrane protein